MNIESIIALKMWFLIKRSKIWSWDVWVVFGTSTLFLRTKVTSHHTFLRKMLVAARRLYLDIDWFVGSLICLFVYFEFPFSHGSVYCILFRGFLSTIYHTNKYDTRQQRCSMNWIDLILKHTNTQKAFEHEIMNMYHQKKILTFHWEINGFFIIIFF